MRQIKLTEETKKDILTTLLKRSPSQYPEYEKTVSEILNNVRNNGDKAVFEYTEKFDGYKYDENTIRVTEKEINEAYNNYDKELIAIMEKAFNNIKEYHEKQKQNSWISTKEDGTLLGVKVSAIEKAGVYVPGGKAAYPSSTLMCVIPALVAGVERIVMVTPANREGKVADCTLVAAKICGVNEIYKVGGAQAIAALAYGTETIPKVDKIVGPGNIFVALAKKAVFGHVSYVAADLLSQAEHDQLASAILLTTSKELADKVSAEVDNFLKELSRTEIIEKSLENYGYIILCDSIDDAIDAANEIASEHLEILTKNPYETMTKIKNAGAIFLGEYSSEPLGDYFAGPNHVLPTNGTAKFFSPLSVDAFIKKTSIISYSKDALKEIHTDIERFALSEGLSAHAN